MPIQQSSLAQAVLDEERRQRERAEQRAAESLFSARVQSPDRAALAQQAAAVLGRAPIEIDESAQQEARAARELEALRGHHATINWIADPENAAVGHDQIEQLTLIERIVLGARTGTLGAQTAIGLGDLGRRAVEGLGLGLGAITRGAGTLAEMEALSRGATGQAAVGRRIAAAGERMESGARNLGGTLTRDDLRRWTAAGEQPLPQAATDTGFSGDVASGLGQIAGQVAVAVGSGGTLTLPALFSQGVGSMDERVDQRREREGRDEGGYTTGEAAALLGAGVVTGLSEKVGLDAVLGRLPKPIQQRLTNRFIDILIAGAVEGSSEVVEGIGHNALARYALGEEGGLLDGTVEGGSVGAAVGSIARALALTAIPGRQHVNDTIRAEAAQTEAERFDRLVDIVAANPLMTRSPERLQAFLAQVGDGRAVYVPAEAAATFFQSDPANEALLDEWGIRDQYEQAMASGADIAIDASVYLAKVAQTPAHAAWREELRHGLEAMSLREAAEFASTGEQRLTEELDTAVEAAEALSREETPERRVYDDWFSQGRAAGLIREVADANAQVVAAMFARRAARSGGRFTDAWAAYRDANLTIARQFPESLRAERTDARLMTLYTALKSGRAAPSQRAMFGRSLAEFVSQEGGIFDTGGELAAMGADQWHRQRRFRRKLVRADDAEGKFGADYVAERAVAAGYLPEGATGNDLLEALREEIAGRPVFATNADLDPAAAENAQALDDLEELLANAGLNAQTATYEEVKAAVERFASAPTTPRDYDRAYEQFAGEKALTAPLRELDRARVMENNGALPGDIHDETGWFRGDEGEWRFEISDEGMAIKPDANDRLRADAMAGRSTPLSEVIEHPALFAAYPQLADTATTAMSIRGSGMVARKPDGSVVLIIDYDVMEREPEKALNVLVHEIQHLIQELEGFAVGAPVTADLLRAAGYGDALDEAVDAALSTGFDGSREQAEVVKAWSIYRRSAGEIEARNTEKRRNLTDDERRDFPPAYTRDVKRDLAIVRRRAEEGASFSVAEDEVPAVDARSAAFKRWFGDSKVVDENGEPLVVYHGTAREFEAFDPARAGSHYGRGGRGGFFFSESPDAAWGYALERAGGQEGAAPIPGIFGGRPADFGSGGGNTVPVFLSLQRPLVRKVRGNISADLWFDKNEDRLRQEAEAAGADGFIIKGPRDGIYGPRDLYIAFEPTQIKSVFNRGTFDPADPRILFQGGEGISDLMMSAEEQGVRLDISDPDENGVSVLALIDTRNADDGQGAGVGTRLMERVVAWADREGVRLALTPDEIANTPVDRLRRFYRRFGFRENTNAGGDLQVFEEMVRDPRTFFQSDDTSPPFFSALLRAVENSQTKRAPAAQWKATLAKVPGVKKEEIEWSGINEWLDDAEGPVDRDSVAAFLRAGGVRVDEVVLGYPKNQTVEARARELAGSDETYLEEPDYWDSEAAREALDGVWEPQFRDWKLPGADDSYREVLLTLPSIEGPSTHWDTQNVVAHARLTERTDADGKRVLFIEEVQSDWHQKGRDQGYRGQADPARLEAAKAARDEAAEQYDAATEALVAEVSRLYATADESRVSNWSEQHARVVNGEARAYPMDERVRSARALADHMAYWTGYDTDRLGELMREQQTAALRMNEAQQAVINASGSTGIPDAPFRTSWPALVMKRMIRWAVDHGYERVAWTTGEQQAARYSLSQAVGGITAERRENGEYEVTTDSAQAAGIIRDNGMARASDRGFDSIIMSADQMRQAFGENVSKQLLEGADALADQWAEADRLEADVLLAELEGDDARVEQLRARAAELNNTLPTRRFFRVEGEENLRVGGEGMKAFYDRNLVNITNDIVKRYGARVGPINFRNPRIAEVNAEIAELRAAKRRIVEANEAKIVATDGLPFAEAERVLASDQDFVAAQAEHARLEARDRELRQELLALGREADSPLDVQPGFDITPQLREAAMSGFPLFQKGRAKGPRGQVDFSDPERAAITLFSGADPTTPFHEALGHVSLELLIRDAADPRSSEETQRDLAIVLDYLNVRDPADIGRDQHELWASTVERYFMEGRAPSLPLRDVMNRIRSWFVSIYKRLTHPQVNVPITDEVRSVLDRMLASEEEIAAAREAMRIEAGFADAAAAGMTEAAFADYQRLVERARGDAEDELMRRMMRVIRQRRTEEWNAEADAIRPDVVAEIDAQPDIRALNWLRGNKVALNREVVVRMLGDEAGLKLLPKGVPPLVGKNGVHPDSVAEVAGYNSGMELLDGLMTLEAEKRSMVAAKDNRSVRQARIDREIERRVNELLGDPLTDGSIEAEAMAALHTERQAEVLAVELSVLQRRVGTTPPPLAALRSWAREQIGRRTVREARSGKYLRAERAAANAVQRALAAGDRREAARQKQAQTLNHLLYSEARKAEDFAAAAVRRLSKLDQKRTLRSMDQEYLEQIHALLEQYDLRQASGVQVQRRKGLMEFVNERLALGEEVFVPQELLDAASKRHYSDLTVDELRALDDTVRSLAHLGRLKQTLLDNRDRRDFEQVIDELLSQVQDLPARKGLEGRNRRENGLRQIDAALWKMETLFDWLDKDDIGGVFNRVLLRPAVDAANRNDQLHESVGRAIREVYEAVPRDQKKRWLDKVSAPELTDRETGEPSQFVRSDLIAMALNVGNASNLDKLTRGEEWTPEDVMTVLNRELTAEEWQFVQGIWDALETLWPEIARVERILTGVEPERVDPMPVKTATAGELRGGYYPVKYDRSRNPDAARWDAAEAADLFNNVITGAATPKGHTISRSSYAGPVLLSVEGVLFGHISNVIARVSHGEYVQSALKFIRDPRVRQVVEKKVGPEYYAQLEPWLKSQVTDRARNNRDLEGIEKFVKRARLNFQMVAMGLRVTTGLAQVAGLAVSAGVVNPARLGVAVARYAMSIRLGRNDLSDFAFEKSEELRQRMRSRDRDIRDAMRDLTGKSGVIPAIQQAAFLHIGIMDQFVSVPTWLAAYEDAIARGAEEADAIALGDKAVRLSQGTGREYALAAVQRPNSEFMKLFTLFYSFFSVQYQRQRDVARAVTTGDTAKAISLTFWVFIMGPLLGALLTGDGPDEDDGEGLEAWLAWGARKAFFNLFTGVPFVRDATGFLERKIAGEYAEYAATPLNRIGSSLFRAGEVGWDAATGEDVSPKWLKQVMEPIGYVVGLPTGQLANTAQYVKEVFDGTQEPDNLAEFAYGLAKGPQTDQE